MALDQNEISSLKIGVPTIDPEAGIISTCNILPTERAITLFAEISPTIISSFERPFILSHHRLAL
jgi:hypothetical protein